jgi:alanine dehydrogenase
MSEEFKKPAGAVHIPKELVDKQFHPREEMMLKAVRQDKLVIGIPLESTLQENRVPLVPASVATLVAQGHQVLIERGAGLNAHFSDRDFSEAGALIADKKEEVYKAAVILKAAPPTIEEIDLMFANQILISPLQMPTLNAMYFHKLRQNKVLALAMEYIKDEADTFPLVRIMSEMAGIEAMLTAAELLSVNAGGNGVLLGGISGVPSAKVVILGAGIVAEYASRVAIGLGAELRIFDNDIYKLKRLQNQVGRQLYTSSLNPIYLQDELVSADVVIGAIHSKSGRTPVIVSEEMIQKMKHGAVIIDVSIDQGGCFATSEVTTLQHPSFIKYGVIHYCVPNITSRIPRTASVAISNILTPILLHAATAGGIESWLFNNPGLRHGVYTYNGYLCNAYLGERFDMKATNLDLIITSQG